MPRKTFLVGVSRFLDEHHRPEDIATGLGIGIGSAAYVFSSHFRPWWAAVSDSRKGGSRVRNPLDGMTVPFMDGEGLHSDSGPTRDHGCHAAPH
ncbi:hypothetical protein T484DRAFT_1883307 [Baffinella frigidus]|nr:hypothetical protein T484DRAFT_1883307 [Cryptophyta sp. CCMP2293]